MNTKKVYVQENHMCLQINQIESIGIITKSFDIYI
jgi:hypothetical protein